jgi:hypothetical protein
MVALQRFRTRLGLLKSDEIDNNAPEIRTNPISSAVHDNLPGQSKARQKPGPPARKAIKANVFGRFS